MKDKTDCEQRFNAADFASHIVLVQNCEHEWKVSKDPAYSYVCSKCYAYKNSL